MLHKFIENNPQRWHQWIPFLLFATREVPQAGLGGLPFELLYGRHPRGILDLFQEEWEEAMGKENTMTQYVLELREELEDLAIEATDNLTHTQMVQKKLFDKGIVP